MGIGLADTLRSARAQKIIDAINAGAGPGTLLFYTATQPAKGAAITTQTLLGTVMFAEPAGSISNSVITFDTIVDDSSADADGQATWARVLDGDGAFVMDLTITDNAGAGPIKMPSTQIYAGGILHVTSAVLTEGNA